MKKLIGLALAMAMLFALAAPLASAEGGTVYVGCGFDVSTLDPGHSYEYYCNMITYAIYENLLKLMPGSEQPQPCLAQSYSVSEDALTYTFKLRDDVRFFSGNPLTSKDVKWSFERMANLQTTSSVHCANIASIETPDDYTVVITLKQPDSSFTTKLTVNTFAVLDSSTVAANGGLCDETAVTNDTAQAYLDQNPAGSGPFMVESFNPGMEIVLVRNPNYWGDPAKADKVVVENVADANTAMMMLESGDLDVALNLTGDQAAMLAANPQVTVENVPTNTITYLLCNMDESIGGPVANADVRRAIAYAIHYENIQTLAGEGAFTPISVVQSSFVGYAGERQAGYTDVEKARELLSQAGYAGGFDITLEVGDYEAGGTSLVDLAQMVANDLKQVGINVQISVLDSTVAVTRYVNAEQPFALWLWTPDYNELNNQLAFMPGEKTGALANWSRSDAPEIAELSDQVARELDQEKRAVLSKELQEIVSDGGPWVVLCQHPRVVAYAAGMEGVYSSDTYHLYLAALSPAA